MNSHFHQQQAEQHAQFVRDQIARHRRVNNLSPITNGAAERKRKLDVIAHTVIGVALIVGLYLVYDKARS